MDFGVGDLKKLMDQLGTLAEDIKSIKLRLKEHDDKILDLNKITTAKFDSLETLYVSITDFDKVVDFGAKEDIDFDKRLVKLEKSGVDDKRVSKIEKDVAALQKKVK